MSKHCPRCSAQTEVKALGSLTVEEKPLKLTVNGMPAAKCPKGHASPVDNDFMLWLIHQLKNQGSALPTGSEKGMLFKKYHCACGAELPAKPEQQSFPFDLAYPNTPPFKAELGAPVYKCAACSKVQLRSTKDVQGHAAQMIMSLNDAAGFPHSS